MALDLSTAYKTDPVDCPHCGHTMRRFTGPSRPPSDGAVTACILCCQISLFEGGKLKRPTFFEMLELMARDDVHQLIHAMTKLSERRKAGLEQAKAIPEAMVPGGVKESDFLHLKMYDETCSRCRKDRELIT